MPWAPLPPAVSGPLIRSGPALPGVGSGVATGAKVAGAASAGFSLIKLVVVLAVIAGVTGSVVALRHHHLAEGYLYQDSTNSGLIYFHIEETWYGGDVNGTFYTPYLSSCQGGGQVKDVSLNFEGTVNDSQVVLVEKAFGLTVFQATFSRTGEDLVLANTQVIGWTVPQETTSVFKASSDANYATAKQLLAQAACTQQ